MSWIISNTISAVKSDTLPLRGLTCSTKPHLDYPTALANGWPIATGVIEGACRHLAVDILDITGARWGLDGAEAVLKLRAITSNGDLRHLLAAPPPVTRTTTRPPPPLQQPNHPLAA